MENKWTDRDELDRINNTFDEIFDSLKNTIYNIKNADSSCAIGNIGLYAGNKMRSMYRRYKEKEVNYSNSIVNKAVETYLVSQCDTASYELKRFLVTAANNLNKRDVEGSLRRLIRTSPNLKEYKNICDEVYEFDLDKDAVTAIDYLLDNIVLPFGIEINVIIDEYNNELEQLGVSQRINHRELDESLIEIPDEELMILKFIVDEIVKQMPMDDIDFIESEEPQEKEFQKIIRRNDETNKE